MHLVFRPEAHQELLAAQAWYELRSPGLGFEFSRAVDAALTMALRMPLASGCHALLIALYADHRSWTSYALERFNGAGINLRGNETAAEFSGSRDPFACGDFLRKQHLLETHYRLEAQAVAMHSGGKLEARVQIVGNVFQGNHRRQGRPPSQERHYGSASRGGQGARSGSRPRIRRLTT